MKLDKSQLTGSLTIEYKIEIDEKKSEYWNSIYFELYAINPIAENSKEKWCIGVAGWSGDDYNEVLEGAIKKAEEKFGIKISKEEILKTA